MSEEATEMAGRARLIRWLIAGEDQKGFARQIGMKQACWNNFETGYRKISYQAAYLLQRKFGITIEYILDGDDQKLNGPIGDEIKSWSGPPPSPRYKSRKK